MTEHTIISRAEAKAKGFARYFTGVPCPRGHLAQRYVSSFICVECQRTMPRDKKREYNRRWRTLHREQRRRALADWRAKNPEKNKAYDQRQRVKRADQRKVDFQRWQRTNSHKTRSYSANRRAMKARAEGIVTPEDIERIYRMQKGRCAYCRKKLGKIYERDHVIPLSKGGSNRPSNTQLVCRFKCNQRKRNKDPLVFARECGLLI